MGSRWGWVMEDGIAIGWSESSGRRWIPLECRSQRTAKFATAKKNPTQGSEESRPRRSPRHHQQASPLSLSRLSAISPKVAHPTHASVAIHTYARAPESESELVMANTVPKLTSFLLALVLCLSSRSQRSLSRENQILVWAGDGRVIGVMVKLGKRSQRIGRRWRIGIAPHWCECIR